MSQEIASFANPSAQPAAIVQALDHVNLTVRSLEETFHFYSDLLSFRVVERGQADDGTPWAIMQSGEAMLCLGEFADLEPTPRFPQPAMTQEVRHFAVRVTNEVELQRRLEAMGIHLVFGGPVRFPHSTSYYITDPSGHQVELVVWDANEIRFPAA